MKLSSKNMGREYGVELTPDESGTVRITVTNNLPEKDHVILDQVTALSLARMIEEQVKDIRRG